MNIYQRTMEYLSEGERLPSRNGPIIWRSMNSSYYPQSVLRWMTERFIDQDVLKPQQEAFLKGGPMPVNPKWNLPTDNPYHKAFFEDGGLERVIKVLSADRLSRHAVITIPTTDNPPPCWLSFSFYLIDGYKLCLSGHSRSLDMWNGLPYDLLVFNEAIKIVTAHLRLAPGALTVAAPMGHIYEDDLPDVKRMLTL